MDALSDIVAEAVRLGLAGGMPLVAVIGIVLVAAVVIVALKRMPEVKLPRPPVEEPPPPAVWDTNVEQNTDPKASDTGGG